MMEDLKLKQIVNTPTHQQGNILDHVYVPISEKEAFKVLYTLHSVYFSDHECILLACKITDNEDDAPEI